MAHVIQNQKKLLTRVRRVGGQVAALEKALIVGADCADVLVQIAAVRGAVHGLMIEVLNEHLQEHVAAESDPRRRAEEANAIAELVRTYMK